MTAMTRPLTLLVVASAAVAVLAAATPTPQPPPEVVEIAALADWFAPVAFPHAVHAELAGDCVSCHHHSDGEPVPCGTCHEIAPAVAAGEPPVLRVAYHRQCVGCHADAGAPVTCEGCHLRRRLPRGPVLGPAAPG